MGEVNSQNIRYMFDQALFGYSLEFPIKIMFLRRFTEPLPTPMVPSDSSDWRLLMTYVLERVFYR